MRAEVPPGRAWPLKPWNPGTPEPHQPHHLPTLRPAVSAERLEVVREAKRDMKVVGGRLKRLRQVLHEILDDDDDMMVCWVVGGLVG